MDLSEHVAKAGAQQRPAEPGAASPSPAEVHPPVLRALPYPHVPDLALTGLTGAGGETLYLGLRHALIHANEVTPDYLRHLSDDQFSAMLIAWFRAQPCSEIDERNIPDVIGDMRAMAASPKSAKTIAVFCCVDLCNFMYAETLSTALLANPQVVNKAESGTPPPLPVVSIALLRREDVDNWVTQNQWFDRGRGSGQARVDRLELREPSARLRQLKTRVTFRQFVFPVDGADLGARVLATTRASAEQLLGRLVSPEPGGDLASGVKGLGARLRKSAKTHATLQALHYRACRDEGRDHPSAVAVHRRIERVEQEIERLRSNIRTLRQAGAQLKALWVRCGGWPAAAYAHAAAARLALIGHIMGETPMLSCARGQPFACRLEGHVQLLAAVADDDAGNLPGFETEESPAWADACAVFGRR